MQRIKSIRLACVCSEAERERRKRVLTTRAKTEGRKSEGNAQSICKAKLQCLHRHRFDAAIHCSMFNPISCSYSLPSHCFIALFISGSRSFLYSCDVYTLCTFSIFTCSTTETHVRAQDHALNRHFTLPLQPLPLALLLAL